MNDAESIIVAAVNGRFSSSYFEAGLASCSRHSRLRVICEIAWGQGSYVYAGSGAIWRERGDDRLYFDSYKWRVRRINWRCTMKHHHHHCSRVFRGHKQAVTESETPNPDLVATWPDQWCAVQPGAPRSELLSRMGRPTSAESIESASWEGFGYFLTADFDVNGNVLRLHANPFTMTPEQRASFPCDLTRPPEDF